ncbi:MAG: methyltransferase domain-containing protein [Patescibacteria group bacterium]
MQNIADYDKQGYDYTQYWEDKDITRKYEDQAERIAIKRMLRHIPEGGTYLDLGAGFGRLFGAYASHFDTVIVSDYSIENLKKAHSMHATRENTYFVAANAYHLPFRDQSLSALQTVRMMHHIENADGVMAEISRTIKESGYAVIEYANKRHFLAVVKYFMRKGKRNPFKHEPEDQSDLFYNFHPTWIEGKIRKSGLSIRRILSVSNLRAGLIKKILPVSVMVLLEKVFQILFAPIRFAPSIFVLAQKGTGKLKNSRTKEQEALTGILQCPSCTSHLLLFAQTHILCNGCHKSYPIIDGIYDFRV